MKVTFGVTENKDFTHVRAEAYAQNGTLQEFEEEIKKRYPRFNDYYWRHRPSREEHRDFASDAKTVKFYARFTVPKTPHAMKVMQAERPIDGKDQ